MSGSTTVVGDIAATSTAAASGVTLSAEVPTGTSTPGASVTHKVIVGGTGTAALVYTPEFVIANPGDVVHFDFLARNHTVTQSTLDLPCVFKTGGVKSGFRANAENTPGKETFLFTVPDAEPKWFYCAQGKHCQEGKLTDTKSLFLLCMLTICCRNGLCH